MCSLNESFTNTYSNNFLGVNKITTNENIPIINRNENKETSLIKGGIIHHEVRKELQIKEFPVWEEIKPLWYELLTHYKKVDIRI